MTKNHRKFRIVVTDENDCQMELKGAVTAVQIDGDTITLASLSSGAKRDLLVRKNFRVRVNDTWSQLDKEYGRITKVVIREILDNEK